MGKKEISLVFVAFVSFLLVFSVAVSAGSPTKNSFWDGVKNAFSYWHHGKTNTLFIKIIILVIISLMIFSLLDTLNLFKNKPATFVISVAAGLLSTYYLSELYVYNLGQIYTAFGGALITILPFLVIGAFTIRAIVDGDTQLLVIQHIAWGIFAAFLLYTIVSSKYYYNFLFWLVFAAAAIMAFANGMILDRLNRVLLRARTVKTAQSLQEIQTGAEILRSLGRQAEN